MAENSSNNLAIQSHWIHKARGGIKLRLADETGILYHHLGPEAVWPVKILQMSIKVAQLISLEKLKILAPLQKVP